MNFVRLLRVPTIRNFFLAASFIALGGVLLVFSPGSSKEPARAQTGGDYSATWQATHLLVARLTRPILAPESNCERLDPITGQYGDPANSEAALGPSRWEVKGQLDANTKFKEIWVTPTIPSRVTQGEGIWWPVGGWGFCTSVHLRFYGNQSQSDWLLGYVPNVDLGYSSMDFRSIPVTEATTSISNIEPGNVANFGKTTSCQWTNRCVYTSGPYAWTTFHEIEEASNGKHLNAGIVMPVRWNVTGFLCGAGDGRCD